MYTTEFLQHFPESAYQVFKDNEKSRAFAQRGSFLDITEKELQDLNRLGAGIFFSPNGMTRGERSKKHVTSINAFFVDMDTGTKAEQYTKIISAPCTPSFIIESKNGYHIYFLLTKPLTPEELPEEEFTQIEQTLIDYYGGDPQCKDISRVLRLPGFYHLKDTSNPFKIEISEDNSSITYTKEEIIEMYNVVFKRTELNPNKQEHQEHSAPTSFWEYAGSLNCKEALEKLSGTSYVNGEVFEIKDRPAGGYYIVVNGKLANAWIDAEGKIGSGSKGGPTIVQWLKYYGHSYSKIANIIRAVFQEDIPQEILQGEVVEVKKNSGDIVNLVSKPIEDVKTVQELSDTLIVSHSDTLFFCTSDKNFYKYDEKKKYFQIYTPLDIEKYINNYIIDILGYEKNVTSTLRKEVEQQMTYRCPEIRFSADPYISLLDGLLNLKTLELVPHTKDIFCTSQYDVTLSEMQNMQTPRHDQFVDEIMVFEDDPYMTDPDLKEKYLQIMGYFLAPEKKPHAFIFFVGDEGRNGKGVAATLLKKIIGEHYCTSETLGNMSSNRFSTSALIGKKLNVCGEDESVYIKNDVLKTLASDDSINVEMKYKQGYSYVPNAKHLIMTNSAPRFGKIDTPMKRRLHFIPHFRTFKEHEMDWDIDNKLEVEIPGIIWKFANAYQRLVQNNYVFHKSVQSEKVMYNLESEVSSVVDWFRSSYKETEKEGDDMWYTNDDLYHIYKVWCDDVGRKAVAKINWGKELSKMLRYPTKFKRTDGKTTRGRYLEGVDE